MEFSLEAIAFLMAVAFVAGAIDALAGGGGLLTIPALIGPLTGPPLGGFLTTYLSCTGSSGSTCRSGLSGWY